MSEEQEEKKDVPRRNYRNCADCYFDEMPARFEPCESCLATRTFHPHFQPKRKPPTIAEDHAEFIKQWYKSVFEHGYKHGYKDANLEK